jgi:ribonuclease HI
MHEWEFFRDTWNTALAARKHNSRIKQTGPLTIFMDQLGELGRQLFDDFHIHSNTGWEVQCFELDRNVFDEMAFESWERHLVYKLRDKRETRDLQSVSIRRSLWEAKESKQLQGFQRAMVLGGLLTNKTKSKFNDNITPDCPLRGGVDVDSIYHRVRCCPGVQATRDLFNWETLQTLPDAILLGGLFPHSDLEEGFYRALDEITPPKYELITCTEQRLHLFTDGSCTNPSTSNERLAGYAVTLAEPNSPENMVLVRGILPGRHQNIYRAELTGVLYALATSKVATVYCDNAAVVRGCHRILTRGWEPLHWMRHTDSDLWKEAARLLLEHESARNVTWVKAHLEFTDANGAQQLWQIYHNRQADQAAALDDHMFSASPGLREALGLLVHENRAFKTIKRETHSLHRHIWNLSS